MSSKNENYTILDLSHLIKLAREHAMLGYYETSIAKYTIALDIIKSRIKEIDDATIKGKWKMTEYNISKEIAQTKEILDLCKTLKNNYFDYNKKQVDYDNISKRKLKDQGILVFDMSNSDKKLSQPNLKHFGGKKPFSHNNNNVTVGDPFNDFKDDVMNEYGENVNNEILPENYEEINNNLNYGNYNKNNNKKRSVKKSNSFQSKINNNNKKKNKSENKWNKNNNNINDFLSNNNNNEKNENSIFNPLEEFNLNNSNVGDVSVNSTLTTNNNTFINEINNFMDKKGIKHDDTIINGNKYNKKPINYDDKPLPKPSNYNNNNYNNNYNNNNYNNNNIYVPQRSTSHKSPMEIINDYLAAEGYNNIEDHDMPVYNPHSQYAYNNNNNNNKKKSSSTNNNFNTRKAYSNKVSNNNNNIKKNNNNNNNIKKNNNNNNKNNNNNEKPKNPFLLFRYPSTNGEGPDTALIEMLEREIVESNPNIHFSDIADLESVKNTLQEAVFLPLLIPNFFKGIRRAWKGVLLYGPPGTGKTLLAKALATEGKTTFFNLSASSFASKWRGESEKLVRIVFEMARFYAPTTIFIDEVDSLCSKRGESGEGEASRRVKSEMLVQMDGINSNVDDNKNNENNNSNKENNNENNRPKLITVIGATNRPWDLDEAIRRRFEKRIYIPLPTEKGREQLFNIYLKGIKLNEDIDIKKLVKLSEGYSGADISNVCREAALMPMRKNLDLVSKNFNLEEIVKEEKFQEGLNAGISMNDLVQALKNISKSVGNQDLKVYEKWTEEYKSV